MELCPQDRGVAQISLTNYDASLELYRPQAEGRRVCEIIPVQQSAEDRISVDPGRAGPNQPSLAIDQGARGAFAEREQIKRLARQPGLLTTGLNDRGLPFPVDAG